jgi:hypothetical protein
MASASVGRSFHVISANVAIPFTTVWPATSLQNSMDTIKGLALIGTFLGVLITFAMWGTLIMMCGGRRVVG